MKESVENGEGEVTKKGRRNVGKERERNTGKERRCERVMWGKKTDEVR